MLSMLFRSVESVHSRNITVLWQDDSGEKFNDIQPQKTRSDTHNDFIVWKGIAFLVHKSLHNQSNFKAEILLIKINLIKEMAVETWHTITTKYIIIISPLTEGNKLLESTRIYLHFHLAGSLLTFALIKI